MPGGGPGLAGLQVVGGGGACVGPCNVDGGPGLLEYLCREMRKGFRDVECL